MKKIIVIGAGASGLMAASAAARSGASVEIFEKNEKAGKKLYITGKGRCNLTNNCAPQELMENICSNGKFLYSAFNAWSNQDVIHFFEELGMKTKTERGGRVFPVTDHASDVTAALERDLRTHHVKMHFGCEVAAIEVRQETLRQDRMSAGQAGEEQTKSDRMSAGQAGEEQTRSDWMFAGQAGEKHAKQKESNNKNTAGKEALSEVTGIRLKDGSFHEADAVIVATGGLSYQTTGSTGDGHRFAKELGLKVTECSPSLVPMNTAEEDAAMMQGLSLKNVSIRILDGKKVLYEEFGEMMFTHFGVTGPLILTASTKVRKQLKKKPLILRINLKPALTQQQMDARLVREFTEHSNKTLRNVLGAVYPAKMVPVMIRRSGMDENLPVRDVTKEQRRILADLTQALDFTLTGLRGYSEAIITAGGVSVKEIRPDTMEARQVHGLYFVGEVLDLDAVTGGFNLQIAWSTGHAAGMAAAGQAVGQASAGMAAVGMAQPDIQPDIMEVTMKL